jgi:hypothetical protein
MEQDFSNKIITPISLVNKKMRKMMKAMVGQIWEPLEHQTLNIVLTLHKHQLKKLYHLNKKETVVKMVYK